MTLEFSVITVVFSNNSSRPYVTSENTSQDDLFVVEEKLPKNKWLINWFSIVYKRRRTSERQYDEISTI